MTDARASAPAGPPWSSCRPTTRRHNLARHRERDPRGTARTPPCSSSTTPRLTARAAWPTSWPRSSRASRCATVPAKEGPRAGLPRRLRGRARGRCRAGDPDGRRLVARPALPAGARGGPRPRGSRHRLALRAAVAACATGASRGDSSRAAASLFARLVLGLRPHDLTGGFKAWRAAALAAIAVRRDPLRGLRLPDRDDLPAPLVSERASREVPIIFRDRRVGQSKMSRRIILEALVVVLHLRWEELRGRGPRPRKA